MRIRLVYTLLSLLCIPIHAAEATGLKVSNCVVRHKGDMVDLSFLLDCSNLAISPNEQLRVQPILAGANDTLRLSPLLFTGNIREKVNHRRARFYGELPDGAEHYNVNQFTNSGQSQIAYSKQIPFNDWMYGSRLILESTVTGCADCQRTPEALPLAYIPQKMAVNYIVPHPEQKIRHKKVSLYLNFPQGKSVILPQYMDNQMELAKADSLIAELTGDPYIVVDSIAITGYASPEGKYDYNTRLSGNRAKALKDYLEKKYTPQGYILTTYAASEDWDGLREYIAGGNQPHRVHLLAIIDSVPDADSRDNYIRRLDNGVTYANLLQNIYPLLRRVVCNAGYLVKPFTAEEAEKRLSAHPEQVSLNEMYLIAQTYPPGSPQFNGLFAEMLLYYPDNIVAKNNLAAVALDNGNTELAKECLQSVGNRDDVQNNLGILLFREGRTNEARQCFIKACECGCKEAVYNLREIETYMAIQ